MEPQPAPHSRVYRFGDFCFIPRQQLLLNGAVPVRVGARALELLHALVQRPGDLLSKDELISFAWPDRLVHEANLKVNIAALRRALPRSASGLSYIATVPGRGYRFVAPLKSFGSAAGATAPHATSGATGAVWPAPELIGRDEVVAHLARELVDSRLLTVVGPAGVGKTSASTAAANAAGDRFADGICFVDLSAIDDRAFVGPTIAAALGLESNLINALDGLVDALHDRALLLLLDNCEHVLSTVAHIADHLVHSLPRLRILATSREPLRCRLETVYRLAPLRFPPPEAKFDPATIANFPAMELLVRRAGQHGYKTQEADAGALAAISRRLDGIALAIELAAPRLAAEGAATLLTLLEQDFSALESVKDTTPPRHRTLLATIEWSYRLLSRDEARLLRYLSVFGASFALDDAFGVGAKPDGTVEAVAAWLESLAAKSLVAVTWGAEHQRYRLLDSTRSFAAGQLRLRGESKAAAAMHLRYLLALFERAEAEWAWRTREDWTQRYGHWGNDLRRAIDWAFGAGKDAALGIRLTVAAVPLWNEFSSLAESRRRVRTALDEMARLPTQDPIIRMKLVTAHAGNLNLGPALGSEVETMWKEAGRLARTLGNVEYQLRTTIGLTGFQVFVSRHGEVLKNLAEFRRIMEANGEVTAAPDARRLEMATRFCLGEIDLAHAGLEALAREHATIAHRSRISRFQLDRFVAIRNYYAWAAWVTGNHAAALTAAAEAVEAGSLLKHPLSLAHTLGLTAIPIALLCGKLDLAQEQLAVLEHLFARHHIDTWPPFARFHRATLDAMRGDADGVLRMRLAIDDLVSSNLLIHLPIKYAMLIDMALAHGHLDIARAGLADATAYQNQSKELWCAAEFERLEALLRRREGDASEANGMLVHAIETGTRMSAHSFALRAGVSRVALMERSDERETGLTELAVLVRRMDERCVSTDMSTAGALLALKQK